MKRSTSTTALATVAFFALTTLSTGGPGVYAESKISTTGSAKVFHIGGPFELIDHSGRAVTDEFYRGKYLLISFGFTSCPDICPTTLLEISMTLDRLGVDARKIQPLFITLDPERDSPQVLAEYVANFHPQITGLTGTADQVATAAKAFRTYYRKTVLTDGDYVLDHSTVTFLMAPDGRYLAHFAFGTPPETMARRIKNRF